jgi:thiol-disulfide isomerase/thioredoxin
VKKTLYGIILSAVMGMGIPAFCAVPDSAIQQASTQYHKLFDDARENGDRPSGGDQGDYIDQAYSQIHLDELSLDQVQTVLDSVPVLLSVKVNAGLNDYLTKHSKAPDAAGARAAILLLQMVPFTAKPEERLAAINTTLSHPALAEAVANGYGAQIFQTAASLTPQGLLSIREKLLALTPSIPANASVSLYAAGASFILAAADSLNAQDIHSFSPLRERFSSAVAETLKGQLTDAQRTILVRSHERLDGAFARGELVGFPAPNINFIWFKDPAHPDQAVKSLEDLRGKVVVLDFWATWCGPCRASFPKVKALSRYYRGYAVVVVGVTSLQGFSVDAQSQRIDTKDNPQKELDLMSDFVKDENITWPVAFSKQRVFNPDYGVTGIPDVAIIDPKGIVRYVGLHPDMPLQEKTNIIDKLLAEANLQIPAQLLEMNKSQISHN